MFQYRTISFMMAFVGIVGCKTVPNQDRLIENEKEIMKLRQRIDNGEIKGTYQFGENNQGRYGTMAVAYVDEVNNSVHTISFMRNEKGWFDRKEAVRPLNVKKERPVQLVRPERWFPLDRVY